MAAAEKALGANGWYIGAEFPEECRLQDHKIVATEFKDPRLRQWG